MHLCCVCVCVCVCVFSCACDRHTCRHGFPLNCSDQARKALKPSLLANLVWPCGKALLRLKQHRLFSTMSRQISGRALPEQKDPEIARAPTARTNTVRPSKLRLLNLHQFCAAKEPSSCSRCCSLGWRSGASKRSSRGRSWPIWLCAAETCLPSLALLMQSFCLSPLQSATSLFVCKHKHCMDQSENNDCPCTGSLLQ